MSGRLAAVYITKPLRDLTPAKAPSAHGHASLRVERKRARAAKRKGRG